MRLYRWLRERWSALPLPWRLALVRSLLVDLAGLAGLVCLVWGLALWSAALALTVLGVLLLAAAILGVLR